MIDTFKYDELSNLFNLFSKKVESYKTITQIMSTNIREKGELIYNNRDIARDPTSKYILIRIYT